MLVTEYQKGLTVVKRGTGFNCTQRRNGQTGVTVSEAPFERPGSRGWYADVRWGDSKVAEFEYLHLIHVVAEEAQSVA